ncbi:hypothetical protein ABZ192_15040 [Streptomyces sp. NPDC006235]|uniref:hypothetical protein n=1 Tax=Streptomyces sp. NPDC006235 TaxID=3156736 RepID=UPI00339F84D5
MGGLAPRHQGRRVLTAREKRDDARSARHRFDIPFLARRLVSAIDWLKQRPDTANLPVCLFGAETAAAAVLPAAAERPERISAVVSRGGRPDLIHGDLNRIQASAAPYDSPLGTGTTTPPRARS